MLRVEEFGINLSWREEVTTDDEDLGGDITRGFPALVTLVHGVELSYREDGGLVASTLANS